MLAVSAGRRMEKGKVLDIPAQLDCLVKSCMQPVLLFSSTTSVCYPENSANASLTNYNFEERQEFISFAFCLRFSKSIAVL